MMYTSKQVADGLVIFAEQEILPAFKGWKLYAGEAALFLAAQRSDALLSGIAGNDIVKTMGLVDAEGNLDADAACAALKAAIKKHGKMEVDIPVFNEAIFLTEKDVDALLRCIRSTAGEEKT